MSRVGVWVLFVWFGSAPLVAQDPNLILSVDSTGGVVGSQETVSVFLDSSASQPFTGWSVALCHDAAAVTLESASLGGSVLALDPSFDQLSLLPNGFTSAVVTDFIGVVALEPAPAHELNVATYTLEQVGITDLVLCDDTLGSPPVSISFGTTSILPTLIDGTIDVGTVPNYVLRISEESGAPGESVTTTVELDNLVAIDGFSMGVTHDDAILSLEGIELGEIVMEFNQGTGPDYSFANTAPVAGPGGVCGALFSFTPPFQRLEPGSNHVLAHFQYAVASTTADETEVAIEFSDDLGDPPVVTVLAVQGEARVPLKEAGSVTVSGDPIGVVLFQRGDFNADGAVDLSDAVGVLTFLFASGAGPGCDDAGDVNDDESIGIDDAVSLLMFAFAGGEAPASPFGACGLDPTGDGTLGCALFDGCP